MHEQTVNEVQFIAAIYGFFRSLESRLKVSVEEEMLSMLSDIYVSPLSEGVAAYVGTSPARLMNTFAVVPAGGVDQGVQDTRVAKQLAPPTRFTYMPKTMPLMMSGPAHLTLILNRNLVSCCHSGANQMYASCRSQRMHTGPYI